MSKRYKGAVISATPPTTSTSSASGVWTEQQFMQGVASGSWPALAGAPTIGTATAGALSASVTFTAPTYTGSGITGYTVTSSPGGITGTGASSPVTVSGLTAGTAYTFTVTATTAAGQSSPSAASNSVTPTAPNYIEDVFSTYLYTGTGASITITNNVDAATKGALFWIKSRNSAEGNRLVDTVRGPNYSLESNWNGPQDNDSNRSVTATTSGFTTGPTASSPNTSGTTYVSWTFAEQPKFFDVVTYTGNGVDGRTISHSLGSTPGCVIVKRTDSTGDWVLRHTAGGGTNFLLNTTVAGDDPTTYANGNVSGFSSTTFTVSTGTTINAVNASGGTYVAYLFAHNAGGFGLTGTDNVISCGSFTTDSGGNGSITLGYEPQWVLFKRTDSTQNWVLMDNMRNFVASPNDSSALYPNLSNAESVFGQIAPNATGFSGSNFSSSATYIYIAIRRGPMKVPTSGTSVFSPVARTGTGTSTAVTTPNFPPDMLLQARRGAPDWPMSDRLRGVGQNLAPCYTSAENTPSPAYVESYDMTGATLGSGNAVNGSGLTYIEYFFRRAPGFFDEVCYTGTGGTPTTVSHNLGAVPELMIIKSRSNVQSWAVYAAPLGNTNYLLLNSTAGYATSSTYWNNTTPTSSVFTVASSANVNASTYTYVAYLFATCAGVSKVGTYTGTGATQTINCGFSGGARWVMIKRTDFTGDWYVWDTARGMTSGTDPSISLNSTSGEVNANSVYTTSVGFQLVSTASGINASGETYIFLAIA